MHPMLRQDIQTLVDNFEELDQNLKTLEQDHAVWFSRQEANDLAAVGESLESLKFHVITLQTDCFMFMGRMYQKNGSWQIFDCLHRAFLDLDSLFNNLKTVKTELDESYIRSADLNQLSIDCCRFKKTIEQIQEAVPEAADTHETVNVQI